MSAEGCNTIEDEGGRAPPSSEAPARAKYGWDHGIIVGIMFVRLSRRLIRLAMYMILDTFSYREPTLYNSSFVEGVNQCHHKPLNGRRPCILACRAIQI